MQRVLKEFWGVKHRIEFVRDLHGVLYYNDSKATNPDAAIRGIGSMNRKTLLIGGGYDKNLEFDAWIESFDGKVKCLLLIGQTKDKIAVCARKHGFENIVCCDTLNEAVNICYRLAKPGKQYCFHRHVRAGEILRIIHSGENCSGNMSWNCRNKTVVVLDQTGFV